MEKLYLKEKLMTQLEWKRKIQIKLTKKIKEFPVD